MAVDIGYEILIGTAITADKKAALTNRVLQILQPESLSIVYAATYATGAGSTNQATISNDVTPNFGIRVIMDKAVVGDKKVASLLKKLIGILLSETIVLTHAAAYAAGTRVYNLTITVT